MGRKKVWQSDTERLRASRERRKDENNGPEALRLMQFSLTLGDKFLLEDLAALWECTRSQVVHRLLREGEEKYSRAIHAVQEHRREARKKQSDHDMK